MNKKAVLVILAVLVPLLQASGEVTDGKSGNGPVNINFNLPGYYLGGGDILTASQENLLAELQGQVRDMELQNADLTDKLTDLQEQLRNMTTELWLHKKACCNKTLVCPSGYEKFLDRCYKFSTDKKNFTDARSACQAAGGHLAMPKDKATNDFLVKQLKAKNISEIWIGLTDLVTEGTFVFEDGTSLSWSNWAQGIGAPFAYPDYDCVALTPYQGEWGTSYCSMTATYVCEVSATVSH
ncbi:Collectin-11 [Branchiostoma belcheri]|nr:Collectin-11 [Branchiostoma belcheri]